MIKLLASLIAIAAILAACTPGSNPVTTLPNAAPASAAPAAPASAAPAASGGY